jgi:integrase
MAIIRIRNGIIHLQYYDPLKKKTTSRSLGTEPTKTNLRKSYRLAKQVQEELTQNNRKRKMIGIKDISIREAFDKFLAANGSNRPKTILDYKRFFKFFKESFNEEASTSVITKLTFENWLSEIKMLGARPKKPLKPNTIYGLAKQGVHFCKFLFEYSNTAVFIVNKAIMPKPVSTRKIVFDEDDVKIIIEKLADKNENFKLLINLLAYTGLRSSDVLGINAEGIDLKKQIISYYSLKTKNFRDVPYHPALHDLLTATIAATPAGKILGYSNTTNLNRAIIRYFVDIKIDKKGYTARTFRKTFITWARNKFAIDATIVRELIGHSHRNIMDRHYNDITIDDMRKELVKFQL